MRVVNDEVMALASMCRTDHAVKHRGFGPDRQSDDTLDVGLVEGGKSIGPQPGHQCRRARLGFRQLGLWLGRPAFPDEGWFDRETDEGGADKLGHFYTAYLFSHLFAGLYERWDFDKDQAIRWGALSSLGVTGLIEVGDAFSDYGFSYQDMVFNTLGAAAGYLLWSFPELSRKIDLRVEYNPFLSGDREFDVTTDYDRLSYLIAFKAEGFDFIENPYLKYLELHVGFRARNYAAYSGAARCGSAKAVSLCRHRLEPVEAASALSGRSGLQLLPDAVHLSAGYIPDFALIPKAGEIDRRSGNVGPRPNLQGPAPVGWAVAQATALLSGQRFRPEQQTMGSSHMGNHPSGGHEPKHDEGCVTLAAKVAFLGRPDAYPEKPHAGGGHRDASVVGVPDRPARIQAQEAGAAAPP